LADGEVVWLALFQLVEHQVHRIFEVLIVLAHLHRIDKFNERGEVLFLHIQELRELTAYDELQLDTLGDRKTALFIIMSDTDDTFNFLISMCYTQLFNLLCEKADDVYGGACRFMSAA